MSILFTICGRAGSKGVKDKNLRSFLGFPLPFYTVSIIDLYMINNPGLSIDVVLSTDSEELIELFTKKLQTKVEIIRRKACLALDNTPKIPVIRDCLETMECRRQMDYSMVVDLDITSPLRKLIDLQNLIAKKNNSNADVVFSVTDSRRNPYFNMVKKSVNSYERVIQSSFNTRQEAPEIFDMNASMYAYCPRFLKSGKGIFDGKCDVIKMMDTGVLDIDSEQDFELMQVVGEYLFNKYVDFREVRDNIGDIIRK
jgi:CMP-N,N'-diacetyllegionaminic acid synthase